MTGKLLAVALALGHPFTTQTISLIGFSLGSQVIKSTIKTLHKIGVHDLIQNVHFLGGACHWMKDDAYWQAVLSKVVRGRATNSFSREDKVLVTYFMVENKDSIGRFSILNESLFNAKQ